MLWKAQKVHYTKEIVNMCAQQKWKWRYLKILRKDMTIQQWMMVMPNLWYQTHHWGIPLYSQDWSPHHLVSNMSLCQTHREMIQEVITIPRRQPDPIRIEENQNIKKTVWDIKEM